MKCPQCGKTVKAVRKQDRRDSCPDCGSELEEPTEKGVIGK